MKYAGIFAAMLLTGCGSTLTPPTQPTPTSVQIAIAQVTAITADPVTTWQVTDEAVRAACFAYLNSAASQQTNLGLASIGIGAVGAGMSLFNPLAGLGASLGQTLLAGLSSSGYVPTTADAIMVENYLNVYEAAAGVPSSNAMAISWAVDEWYHCSAGGIAELAMQAKTTAQLSVIGPSATRFSAQLAGSPVNRPIIGVNHLPQTAPLFEMTEDDPVQVRRGHNSAKRRMENEDIIDKEWRAIQQAGGRNAYEQSLVKSGSIALHN